MEWLSVLHKRNRTSTKHRTGETNLHPGNEDDWGGGSVIEIYQKHYRDTRPHAMSCGEMLIQNNVMKMAPKNRMKRKRKKRKPQRHPPSSRGACVI